MQFTAATYNIHKCVGRDGRFSPARINAALAELAADIIAVQEFDNRARHKRPDVAPEDFASPLDMHCVAQPTMEDPRGGFHGNLLLSRYPVNDVHHIDLGQSGPETRRAILARIELPAGPIAVVATHLGLSVPGRRRQARVLLDAVDAFAGNSPIIMLGDFNEWLPVGGCHGILAERFDGGEKHRTFPVTVPLFPLDRIWVRGGLAVNTLRVHRTPTTSAASDHLPVVAEVSAPPAIRPDRMTNSPGTDETSTISP